MTHESRKGRQTRLHTIRITAQKVFCTPEAAKVRSKEAGAPLHDAYTRL